MALRAGYKGVKNSMLSSLKVLASLGIKSLGTMFNVSNKGVLSVKKATGSAAGIVQPDGETITINNGVISAAASGGGGDMYNADPVQTGEYLGNPIYTRAIQYFDNGAPATGWSGSASSWTYSGLSAGDIDCILDCIILNETSGVYSITDGVCTFDNSTGVFTLNFVTGTNTYLLLKYFVSEEEG